MEIKQAEEFFYRINNLTTASDICLQLNTNPADILRNNPKLGLYSGEIVKIKTNKFVSHIVKPLETIEKIAMKYGVLPQDIVLANNLKTDKLFIGQQLKIYDK